jgi:GYF domain 2
MANYFIIGGDGKQYGPITTDDLHRWIAEGRLNAESRAKEETDTEWRALAAFPEFAAVLGAQAPATIAPPLPDSADSLERDYELDIGGCISRGWQLVKNNFWPVVGVNALVTILLVVINQFFGLFTHPAMNSMIVGHQISAGAIATIFLISFISAPIYTVFTAGLFKYYLNLIRGEEAGIGDAFSGFGPSFGQLVLLGLVQFILVMIGYLLCVIPGIYLGIAWYFAMPLVIDKRLGFWEALESSRKMVSKHWFIVFAFFLVCGLVVAAGIIGCFIGILVTMPISFAALMYAYETIFNGRKN